MFGERCIITRDPLFTDRWIVRNADDLKVAWSGSRWVPLYGDVAVSNLDTKEQAMAYARGFGFEVTERAV
jgi:hypothetical protein